MLQLIVQIIQAQSNIFVALSFLVGLFTMVICFAAHPLSVNFTDVMVGCWAVSFGCLILGMISHVFSCGIAGGFGFFLSCVFCWTQLTSPTGVRVEVAVSYDVCSYIENVVIPQTGVEWSHLTYGESPQKRDLTTKVIHTIPGIFLNLLRFIAQKDATRRVGGVGK